MGMGDELVGVWDIGVFRAFREYNWRFGVVTLGFGSSGWVKRQIKWFVWARRRANIRFWTRAVDQWMVLAPSPQGRGWVKMNWVGTLEVCVWKEEVCTACAEGWDIVA